MCYSQLEVYLIRGRDANKDGVPAGRLKVDAGGGDSEAGDENLERVSAVIEPITRRLPLGGSMRTADR